MNNALDVPLPGFKSSWRQNLKPRLEIIALWLVGWGPMFAGTGSFDLSVSSEQGFDWLEFHCAHGYFLSSFISPLTNQRKDE